MKKNALVLGIGNSLLQDEGLGMLVIEYLRANYVFDADTRILDGGVMCLTLLPFIEGCTDLLIIGALGVGRSAGTIVRLENDALQITQANLTLQLSIPQVSLLEMLPSLKLLRNAPRRIVLWGMQPASRNWGMDLSIIVAAQLSIVAECAVRELCNWGYAVRFKPSMVGSGVLRNFATTMPVHKRGW